MGICNKSWWVLINRNLLGSFDVIAWHTFIASELNIFQKKLKCSYATVISE